MVKLALKEKCKVLKYLGYGAAVMVLAACSRDNDRGTGEETDSIYFGVNAAFSQGTQTKSSAATEFSEPMKLQGENPADTLFLHPSCEDGITSPFEEKKLSTKGTPLTTANFATVIKSFGVTAYTQSTASLFMNSVKVVNGTGNIWKPQANTYYWPWGDALDFYAYAPYTVDGKESSAKIFGAGGNTLTISPSTKKASFSYTVPTYQVNGVKYDAESQPDLCFAHATGSLEQYGENPVPLTYSHALSAVKFVAKDVRAGSIKSITIKGIYGKGTAVYDPSSATMKYTWTTAGDKTSFTQTFNVEVKDYSTLPSGTTQQITDARPETTFMLIPQALTADAKVEVVLTTSAGTTVLTGSIGPSSSASAKYTQWEPGKTYIYTISSSSINWIYDFEVTDEISPTLGILNAKYSVKSYRYRADNPSVKEAVAWSTDFFDGSTVISKPHWINDFTTKGAGNATGNAVTYPMSLLAQEDVTDYPGDELLKKTTPLGTEAAPYDLSTRGGTTSASTANCYMVSAPGYYRLPLVYGNALKNGAANTASYTYQDASATDADYLKTFLDYKDKAITSPYIPASYVDNALLLWEDVSNMVKDVHLSADKKYIEFYIDPATIEQGNAVIAVRDADNKVVWSWHIWTFEKDLDEENIVLDDYNDSSTKYYLSSYNLGWSDSKTVTFIERSVVVYFIQEGTGAVEPMTVKQKEEIIRYYCGNSSYYQWGRKDPMIGIQNKSATSIKYHFSMNDEYVYRIYSDDVPSLGESIQNPNVFYGGISSTKYATVGYYNDWVERTDGLFEGYYNLWDNRKRNDDVTKSIKTIYDPAPVGWKMPPRNTFTVTASGSTSNSSALNGSVEVKSMANGENTYIYAFYPQKDKKGTPFKMEATGARWYRKTSPGLGNNFNSSVLYCWTAFCWSGNSRGIGVSLAVEPSAASTPNFSAAKAMARPVRVTKDLD